MGHVTQAKHLLRLTPTNLDDDFIGRNDDDVKGDLCVQELADCLDCMECWPDKD